MAESSSPTARVSERIAAQVSKRIAICMDLALASALAGDFFAEDERAASAPRACPGAPRACAHEKTSAMHSMLAQHCIRFLVRACLHACALRARTVLFFSGAQARPCACKNSHNQHKHAYAQASTGSIRTHVHMHAQALRPRRGGSVVEPLPFYPAGVRFEPPRVRLRIF